MESNRCTIFIKRKFHSIITIALDFHCIQLFIHCHSNAFASHFAHQLCKLVSVYYDIKIITCHMLFFDIQIVGSICCNNCKLSIFELNTHHAGDRNELIITSSFDCSCYYIFHKFCSDCKFHSLFSL